MSLKQTNKNRKLKKLKQASLPFVKRSNISSKNVCKHIKTKTKKIQ